MHTVGLHSALAIKRQRKRREEQKRARERRFSSHSLDSHNSVLSVDGVGKHPKHKTIKKPGLLGTKVVTSIGMLHIGVVFLVFGLFLLISAVLPALDDDAGLSQAKINKNKEVWSELLFSGIFCLCLGIFLVVLNKILSKKADDDLSNYVAHQLNRSKSGHRLVRDAETGKMTSAKRTPGNNNNNKNSTEELQNDEDDDDDDRETTPPNLHLGHHSHHHPHHHVPISSPPPVIEGEPPLEKIIEEDGSEYSIASNRPQRFFASDDQQSTITAINLEIFNKETISTDISLSPTTPSETQELLVSRNMKTYRV